MSQFHSSSGHSTLLDDGHPSSFDGPSPFSSDDGLEGSIQIHTIPSSASLLVPPRDPHARPYSSRLHPYPSNAHPFVSHHMNRENTTSITRITSEETHALTVPSSGAQMILYRLASSSDHHAHADGDIDVVSSSGHDVSAESASHDSLFALPVDSTYPLTGASPQRFVPYAYDPRSDLALAPGSEKAEDEDDWLFSSDLGGRSRSCALSWRGIVNIGTVAFIFGTIFAFFICYPVISFYLDESRVRDVSQVGYIPPANASTSAVAVAVAAAAAMALEA